MTFWQNDIYYYVCYSAPHSSSTPRYGIHAMASKCDVIMFIISVYVSWQPVMCVAMIWLALTDARNSLRSDDIKLDFSRFCFKVFVFLWVDGDWILMSHTETIHLKITYVASRLNGPCAKKIPDKNTSVNATLLSFCVIYAAQNYIIIATNKRLPWMKIISCRCQYRSLKISVKGKIHRSMKLHI